jgi:hypothetical protein
MENTIENQQTTDILKSERILSIGTGIFITFSGLSRLFSSPLLAITELGLGALLLDRGISGHCVVKGMKKTDRTKTPPVSDPAPMSTAETAIGSSVTDTVDIGTGQI